MEIQENPSRERDAAHAHSGRDASGLDVCLVTTRPGDLRPLVDALTEKGHRTIVTDPARLPVGTEWESYDLVLLDREPGGRYTTVPVRSIHLLVALCEPMELSDPAILRAALHAGARELYPRTPDFHGWPGLLRSARSSAPKVVLRLIDPDTRQERVIPLQQDRLTVGRDPQNDVSFPHAFVSRRHLRVVRAGSRYQLEDLGSRHGTTVNGQAADRHILADGDQIQLGGKNGPVVIFDHVVMSSDTLRALEATGLLDTEAVNRQVHDIAVLLETFLSLNSDLLLEEILELVLNKSIQFVRADRGVILLRPTGSQGEEESDVARPLELALARGRDGESLSQDDMRISQKIPMEVLASGKGKIFEDLLSGDLAGDHRFTSSIGIRSAMCVPLKVRRNLMSEEQPAAGVIGVLYVDSETRGRPFSPRALDALEVLASEVAMAIYSARLYEDSLNKRRMEEEMEIAREIQRNIFPPRSHGNATWELCGTTQPSQQVGGDFLSCYARSVDLYSIVVGDVSGKGVPAALFATMLEGAFHGLVSFRGDVDALGTAIQELNHFLLDRSRLQKFVTAIFGFLDSRGLFHYVNAGHNPPLFLRADAGGRADELESSGTILGMFEHATYRDHVVECAPGDLLVLYSDGLTESRNPAGQAFGTARLLEHAARSRELDVEAVHSAILAAFSRFLDGAEPLDDVTLLVIKRRGSAIR